MPGLEAKRSRIRRPVCPVAPATTIVSCVACDAFGRKRRVEVDSVAAFVRRVRREVEMEEDDVSSWLGVDSNKADGETERMEARDGWWVVRDGAKEDAVERRRVRMMAESFTMVDEM